jgi:tyrosine-protein kinase Etk/Wzc
MANEERSLVIRRLVSLARWRRLIIINTLVVALAAVVVSLVLPKWYRADATVFPPEDEGMSMRSLSALLTAATGAGSGRTNTNPSIPFLSTPSDVYAAMLKSRSVREEIIRKHDLMREFRVETMDEALQTLKTRTKVRVGTEGIVSIQHVAKDPNKAAAIVRDYLDILDRRSRDRRRASAGAVRVFLESRLADCRDSLALAENGLLAVQSKTGILSPDDQTRALVNGAVQIELGRKMREVELGMLRAQVGPDDPDRARLTRELNLYNRQLDDIDRGTQTAGQGSRGPGDATHAQGDGTHGVSDATRGAGDPNDDAVSGLTSSDRPYRVPLNQIPIRTLEYGRALRQVKIQEALYQLLVEQLEQYRILEMRDTPTIQILDQPEPPQKRWRPIRWLICAVATMLAFLFSCGIAFVFDDLERLRRTDPERWRSLNAVANHLHPRRWFTRESDLPAP